MALLETPVTVLAGDVELPEGGALRAERLTFGYGDGHRPVTFEELEDLEGLDFDLIVTLSPKAHHKALELTHRLNAAVEYWPTADPSVIEGSREQRMDAYRELREQLAKRILDRFRPASGQNE